MNAEQTLCYLIDTLLYYLNELSDCPAGPFGNGEKTAYVECLEIVQLWEKAALFRPDSDIESRFPLAD